MPVQLGWLLAQEELALRLVCGSVDGVEVGWAHAIELQDPSPWLAGGELVLTTGLRLPRTQAEQAAYVERLRAVGIAALAFGVGVRFTAIPAGVRHRCEEVGLPLLEVPLPTPFIAVSQAVAHRLAEDQQQALHRVVGFQQALTRRALREGAGGLVGVLAGELDRPVALLEEHGQVLAASHHARPLADSLADSLAASLRSAPSRRTATGMHRVEVPAGTVDLHALVGRTAQRGWLAVAADPPPSADERLMVNHAVAVATLQLDQPRAIEEARESVGATVLRLLLEHAPAEDRLVRLLRHLGFTDRAEVRVVVVPTRREDEVGALLQARLAALAAPHALVRNDGTVVVLVGAGDTEELLTVLRRVLADLGEHASAVGVSGPVPPALAADALVQAREAGRSARQERAPVGWYDRMALGAVLADPAVRGRLRALTRAALAPLTADGRTAEGDLVRSLRVFLEHNGSWETAARALGVHRHTLRNRMTRVEQLTGLSLDVAHHRVVLYLALATTDEQEQAGP
ncbi:PucR family transcriptional regulator [Phycicoccus ginsengisoli]